MCSSEAQFHYPPPPFVWLICSFWLCQQYCTMQHVQCRVFDEIKKIEEEEDGTFGPTEIRTVLYGPISPHIPSPNLIHILFFYILCVYMYSASVCPVVNIFLYLYIC